MNKSCLDNIRGYKVTLESKTGQIFETGSSSKTESEAVKRAFERIEENGWNHRLYTVKKVERI